MNIKTALRKSMTLLDELFQTNPENVNMRLILNHVTESWNYLYRYLKTIDTSNAYYIDMLIKKVNCEDYMATFYMYEDAKYHFNAISGEKAPIKVCLNSYLNVLERLVVYHRDESCCRCQGEVFYYFNAKVSDFIKVCNTCGTSSLLKDEVELKILNTKDCFEPVDKKGIVKIELEFMNSN